MVKSQLIKKSRDFLSLEFVSMVQHFCIRYKQEDGEGDASNPITIQQSTIVQLIEQIIQYNNNDLQITNLRKCLEPFVQLLSLNSSSDENIQFQNDFISLLVQFIFFRDTKPLHKHILFLFNKFCSASNEIRFVVMNEFSKQLKIFSDKILMNTTITETTVSDDVAVVETQLEDDLRQFEWLYEMDSFFNSVLVKYIPQFLQKADQSLQLYTESFLSEQSQHQQSLFAIQGILKMVVLIITEHLSAVRECILVSPSSSTTANLSPEEQQIVLISLKNIMNNSISRLMIHQNSSRDTARVCCLFIYKLLDMTFHGPELMPYFAETMFSSQTTNGNNNEDTNSSKDLFSGIILNHDKRGMLNLVSQFSPICRIAALGAYFNIFDSQLTMQIVELNNNEEKKNFALDLVILDLIHFCEGGTSNSREKLFAIQMLNNAMMDVKQFIAKYRALVTESYQQTLISVIQKILVVIWNNWENPTHNIYDKVRDLFEAILEVHDALLLTDKDITSKLNLDIMTQHLLDLDFNRKGKYFPLLKLLPRVGSQKFLDLCPNVLDRILASIGNGMVNTQASLLYENMAKDQFSIHGVLPSSSSSSASSSRNKNKKVNKSEEEEEESKNKLEQVQSLTLLPVCKYLSGEGKSTHENNFDHILIYIVPKLIKLHQQNFWFCMKQITQTAVTTLGGSYPDTYLRAIVQLLIIGKSENIPFVDEEIQRQLNVINVCFKHFDPKIRLDALNLMTTSTKRIDPCTPLQLRTVMNFICLNAKPPSSAFRNELVSIMKRFLFRLSSSLQNIWTKYEKENQADVLRRAVEVVSQGQQSLETTSNSTDVECFAHMIVFIHDLLIFLQRALYGGCPHEKLLTALTLYQLVYSSVAHQPFIKQFPRQFAKLNSQTLVTQLLNLFVDCWDKVRTLIFDLILLLEDESYLSDHSFIIHVVKRGVQLCSSGRLRESDAGALLLNFVFAKFVVRKQMGIQWTYDHNREIQVSVGITDNNNNSSDSILVFLNNLLKEIVSRTENIKTDILRICTDSPVTGTLLTLRYTFSNFKLSSIINSQNKAQWKEFGQNLFHACNELLSESLQMVGSKKNVDCRGHIHIPNNPLTHNLTVNSWLAVKEATATLGTFTEHVPLSNTAEPIFSEQQFSDLGDLFIKVLLHCKHNGAIEKSTIGFAMTCKRLLSCELPNLTNLPGKWLNYLLDRIATSDDKNSILRRSAGVPYCFMAILKSEPSGVPRVLLPHAMNFLLSITDTFYEGKCGEHTMVHALNVMRFIFQDSTLAGDVTQYIERGFITVLKGFMSSSWPVRNSSLMCYTALITRSVGNRRTKDDYATQNTITSREFFSRYPLLRSYLLEQLKIGTNQVSDLHPTLYPSLLLLSRLRAASSLNVDSVDDVGDVSAFVPYVSECASQKHYLIRSMAARALIPLVPSTAVSPFVLSLMNSIPTVVANRNQNEMHGVLLQIRQFSLMLDEVLEYEMAHQWFNEFQNVIKTSKLLQQGPKYNFVYRTVIFETLSILLKKIGKHYALNIEVLAELVNLADLYLLVADYKQSGDFEGIGFVECQAEATHFALSAFNLCVEQEPTLVKDMLIFIEKCMRHENEKVRINTYKFISHLTAEQSKNTLFTILNRRLFTELLAHVLGCESRSAANAMRFGLQALQRLSVMYSRMECGIDGTCIQDGDLVWSQLMSLHEKTQNCYIKEQSVILLGTLVPHFAQKSNEKMEQWSQIVEQDSCPYQSDNLRSAAQQSILHSRVLRVSNGLTIDPRNLFRVWNVCVRLLQDEEEVIRQETTAMLSTAKKEQVDTVLQDSFTTMTSLFGKHEFYSDFLLSLVALESDDSTGRIIVPFEDELSTEAMPVLFDKEEDNLFQEELFAVQLAAHHLSQLRDTSEEKRMQMISTLFEQLKQVVNMIKNEQELFWIGDVSYHSSVSLSIYRLVLGIRSLFNAVSEQQKSSEFYTSVLNTVQSLVSKYQNAMIQEVVSASKPWLFTLSPSTTAIIAKQ